MSNYSAIKNATNAYIRTNGRQEITGNILNAVMVATIESLGRFYQFVGYATPETDPGDIDQNVAYLVGTPGTYTRLGGFTINSGEIAVLKFDGEWKKEVVIVIPSKVSELTNDLGFITNAVSDLVNYYTKEETYSRNEVASILSSYYDKDEVDSIINSITGQSYVVAWDGTSTPVPSQIPSGVSVSYGGDTYTGTLSPSSGTLGRIYLVSNGAGYDEYITTEDGGYSWIGIGTTNLDLSGYVTQDQFTQLEHEVDEIVDVTISPSPNLFDKTTADVGKYINKTTGTKNNKTSSMGDVCATDYIIIPTGAVSMYLASVGSYSGSIGYAVYDSNKDFTHGGTGKTITIQTGDVYIRFTVYEENLNTAMCIVGTASDVPSEYVPYGDIVTIGLKDNIVTEDKIADGAVATGKVADGGITTPKIADGAVNHTKTDFFSEVKSKNLLNPDVFIAGKWVDSDGTLMNVTASKYGYYRRIPVDPETAYCLTRRGGGTLNDNQSINGYIGFYDADGVFISSTLANNTTTFTTPAGCAFASFSVVIEQLVEPQLEAGSSRTDYEEFFDKFVISQEHIIVPDDSVTTAKIVDKAVTQDKIADGVILPSKPETFNGFRDAGTVSAGQSLTLPQLYIKKAFRLVATISGAVESFGVGVGRTSTYGKYIEVTPTNVIVKVNGDVQSTNPHGLTLGTLTKVLITKGNGGTATIKVVDDYGNVYSTTSNFYAVGAPFVYNGNASASIDTSLSFMPGDLMRPIWIFGDSYLGDNDSARWMNHIITWGYTNFLLDARSGENATQGLVDLQSLISTGARPSFIVWCHGMNNGTDQSGNVNSTWLEKTQAVLDICTTYGITPILATIPTIPSALHDALNTWVRSSGYRYIDFASAVESNVDDYWRGWGTANALLSNDEVHPTSHGAVELAMKVLQDFPEITLAD